VQSAPAQLVPKIGNAWSEQPAGKTPDVLTYLPEQSGMHVRSASQESMQAGTDAADQAIGKTLAYFRAFGIDPLAGTGFVQTHQTAKRSRNNCRNDRYTCAATVCAWCSKRTETRPPIPTG